MIARGDLHRCLVICPGSLAEQWQDELHRRFHLPFEILTNDNLEAARTGNWFLEANLVIARLDKLSRDEVVQQKLQAPDLRSPFFSGAWHRPPRRYTSRCAAVASGWKAGWENWNCFGGAARQRPILHLHSRNWTQTIEAPSGFESGSSTRIRWNDLDLDTARRLIAAAENRKPDQLSREELLAGAALRGLVWHDPTSGDNCATAAGIVLPAKDPSAVFPQRRILADAYRSTEPDGDSRDHEDIRGPMPLVFERAIDFIDRNTRHPMRIVGLNRVRLDEHPVDALREALVNAAAHRQYEDAGRKTLLEVFADRVVLSSPGLPPKPITLASLRKGKYRPCSRNPVLAQCLSYFHRIEERGSGFRRMREHMLNHGLDQPLLSTEMGYFQVTFPGPKNMI